MKLTNLCFMLIAASALSGCNDEVLQQGVAPTYDATYPEFEEFTFPNSDAFKVPMSRAGDSFETDWENCKEVCLRTGEKIPLPWYPGNKFAGRLNTLEANDIKKEDGWVMLVHNFYADPNYPAAERAKYVLFYNQLRGSIKVFYFHSEDVLKQSIAFWRVSFDNTQSLTNGLNELTLPSRYQFRMKENTFGKLQSIYRPNRRK